MDDLLIRRITENLAPQARRRTVIRAGLSLAVFERVRAAVVDQGKTFFVMGFDQRGSPDSPEYTTKVLSLPGPGADAVTRAAHAWPLGLKNV